MNQTRDGGLEKGRQHIGGGEFFSGPGYILKVEPWGTADRIDVE